MTVLLLPGYGDSGPLHWQTHWERHYGYQRVRQDAWERPERDAWVARLEAAVCGAPRAVGLVAHSLGCALVAHWALGGTTARIAGALLVAPPDVEEIRHLLPEVGSFAPLPMTPLPFPTIVVASTSDPYVEPARAHRFATAWGARLVDLGDAGHINADAGFHEWPEGHTLLEELLAAKQPSTEVADGDR